MKKSLKFSKKTKKTKKNFRRKTKKSIHKKYKKTYKKYFGGAGEEDVEGAGEEDVEGAGVEDVSGEKRGERGDDVLDESQIQRRKIEVVPFYKHHLEKLVNPEAELDKLFNKVDENTSEGNIRTMFEQGLPPDHIYRGESVITQQKRTGRMKEANKYGQTLLTFFTNQDKPDVLASLIRSGADVNATNIYGYTPFFYAVAKGSLNTMKVLIENGANPNQKEFYGKTALMYLAQHPYITDSLKKIDTLLQYVANKNETDENGWTALDHAKWHNASEIIQKLEKAGVVSNRA